MKNKMCMDIFNVLPQEHFNAIKVQTKLTFQCHQQCKENLRARYKTIRA